VGGVEPDVISRRLVELYLSPLGYTVRWFDRLPEPSTALPDLAVFLIGAGAFEAADLRRLQGAAERLGAVPIIGLAGDSAAFPAQAVPQLIRQVLRKPVKAADLLAALEHSLRPGEDAAAEPDPLEGLARLAAEMEMDRPMVEELCRSFVDRAARYVEQLRAADEAGDSAQLDGLAHAFKGMAGNLRFTRLAAIADRVRLAAMGGQHGLAAPITELEAEFLLVRRNLEARGYYPSP
jgi:HPt (histidine-containing phosphotransfer) domain-containing protein/CheY-like chemotaxis protein